VGTTSLNLTYSSIGLLVGEPAKNSELTTSTVSITPTGGFSTVDLLKLQNISQTIASAALPAGSVIYSASFTVTAISIEINGTSNPVTLATGGSSFLVTLTSGTVLSGTNAVLLDLTPTVVETPAGYQMIPTSVGIMRPQSEICAGSQKPGWTCPVTGNDQKNFTHAQGQITVSLVALAVSGNETTFSVQVLNSGNVSIRVDQIGLQGNLTVQSNGCSTMSSSSMMNGDRGSRDTGGRGHGNNFGNPGCWFPGQWGQNQLLFTPVSPTTTSSTTASSTSSTTTSSEACSTGQLALSNELDLYRNQAALSLSPGQCITLTFTGTLVFGHTNLVLVPSTAAGQVYFVGVAASNNAQTIMHCTLPPTSTSCTPISTKEGW